MSSREEADQIISTTIVSTQKPPKQITKFKPSNAKAPKSNDFKDTDGVYLAVSPMDTGLKAQTIEETVNLLDDPKTPRYVYRMLNSHEVPRNGQLAISRYCAKQSIHLLLLRYIKMGSSGIAGSNMWISATNIGKKRREKNANTGQYLLTSTKPNEPVHLI